MTQHVTIHQKLSRKWRDEAKSLTAQFQIKSKELRGKIKSLRKENVELHRALFVNSNLLNSQQTLFNTGRQRMRRCIDFLICSQLALFPKNKLDIKLLSDR